MGKFWTRRFFLVILEDVHVNNLLADLGIVGGGGVSGWSLEESGVFGGRSIYRNNVLFQLRRRSVYVGCYMLLFTAY